MNPPAEIQMVNRDGRMFRATYTGIHRSDLYQYRIQIPEFKHSLIVYDVSDSQLRQHERTRVPIKIEPRP